MVLCQQGLQFFPDKAAALREMRRVLSHGGRLALSVWTSAGLYNSAVGEALAQFVGNETAVRFCASRQAPTKEELQRLPTEAGFSAVDVRVSRINVATSRVWKIHTGPFGRNASRNSDRCRRSKGCAGKLEPA